LPPRNRHAAIVANKKRIASVFVGYTLDALKRGIIGPWHKVSASGPILRK
jgi:hypothetical protein